jgi:hypothetical protein
MCFLTCGKGNEARQHAAMSVRETRKESRDPADQRLWQTVTRNTAASSPCLNDHQSRLRAFDLRKQQRSGAKEIRTPDLLHAMRLSPPGLRPAQSSGEPPTCSKSSDAVRHRLSQQQHVGSQSWLPAARPKFARHEMYPTTCQSE